MTVHQPSSDPPERAAGAPRRGRVASATSLAAAIALTVLTGTASPQPSPVTTEAAAVRLTQARAIRADVQSHAQVLSGAKVRLTAPTTTDIVESFTLLSDDLLVRRFVSARDGVWYSICPAGAPCMSAAPRLTRPAADYLPRRLALELAVRTFVETDAPVVAVGLPTPRVVAVVIERDELAREIDLHALARWLSEEPLVDPKASLRQAVDALTKPRTYLSLGLEPGSSGGPSWAGMPRWPTVSW